MPSSFAARAHPGAPAAVFALLTDPEKILRWMGTEAVDRGPAGFT